MKILDYINLVESAVTTLAILIGGLWVYLGYLRGRISEKNLSLSCDITTLPLETQAGLKLSITLKNGGNSVVKIDSSKSVVLFQVEKLIFPNNSIDKTTQWVTFRADRFLNEIQMIEPNESTQLEYLFRMDYIPLVALKIEAKVVSKRRLNDFMRLSFWSTTKILTITDWKKNGSLESN